MKKFNISWYDEEVIWVEYTDNTIIETTDIKEMLLTQEKMGVTRNSKRIVKAGEYTTLTKEAREYVQDHKIKFKAEAFVLNNLGQKILFNFYQKIRKNNTTLKAFSTDSDAIKWIKSI